mgnify:CR=1 FL=1
MCLTVVYIVDVGDMYERFVVGVATTREKAIEIAREHRGDYRSEVNFYEMRTIRLDMADENNELTAELIELD